jgi:hypothetical protein
MPQTKEQRKASRVEVRVWLSPAAATALRTIAEDTDQDQRAVVEHLILAAKKRLEQKHARSAKEPVEARRVIASGNRRTAVIVATGESVGEGRGTGRGTRGE